MNNNHGPTSLSHTYYGVFTQTDTEQAPTQIYLLNGNKMQWESVFVSVSVHYEHFYTSHFNWS